MELTIHETRAEPFILDREEMQVMVGRNAHAVLHDTGAVRKLRIVLKEGAAVTLHAIPVAMAEREVVLAGPGARFDLFERFVLAGREELRTNLVVRHDAARTVSRLDTRGITVDAAKAEVHGLVRIGKDAEGSDSFLGQHALVLDANARARTFPYLEIENNDVKAGHAATTSKLNEEQVFYLRSRGLPEGEARALLALGFLQLDGFAPRLRECLHERLERVLKAEVVHAR